MINKSYSTKSVVEAGLISALIVILMLINAYVPAVAVFGTFVMPIPVTVLYIRHGGKVTLISVVVSTILISMLYNPFLAVTSAIMFGMIGMTLGYCIKNDKKYSVTILFLTIASAVEVVVNFLIVSTFVDKKGLYQTITMYIDMMKESLSSATEIYTKMGVDTAQMAPIKKAFDAINANYLMMLVPAVIIMSAVLSAYVNYIISSAILRKLRYKVNEPTPFSQIYVNNRIGTILILFVLVGMLLTNMRLSAGPYIMNSSMLITQYTFLLDGMALAIYYMKNRFHMAKGFIILLIIVSIFSQVGVYVFLFAGIADLVVDFRKLDPYRKIGNA